MVANFYPARSLDSDQTACPDRPPLFVAQTPAGPDGRPKIRRVLIANRGEIACRVIATCRKLNLTSIAVYVAEDEGSLYISQADESIYLGSLADGGPNPFLDIKLLVETAVRANAHAIHPGYGYLSENSQFADAVLDAGLLFIGPSSQAMSTLGDKRSAKDYLRKHDPSIPLIPGFTGSSQEVSDFEVAAKEIGFPIMLKASAGGGGRGMRIVRERSALRDELARAQSEAARSFGSSDCILEKFIEAGKHIEIQIVGDRYGKVVSLWERECSVQRRHQKVIEETPSPWLSQERREAMSAVAVRIGELLKYEGAGTVEFVVDAITGKFYFLEVNTRLQVEHCITEEVTGLDIVSLQLFVAAGGRLNSLEVLNNIPQQGHSIECRLCAEDPRRDFAPEHGIIRRWSPSLSGLSPRDVRHETGVRTGSRISIYFDSMIAKIVVWAPNRTMAIERMVKVMADTQCSGLRTNQLFLQSCLLHPEFRSPSYTTNFIPDHFNMLVRNPHCSDPSKILRTLAIAPSVFLQKSGRCIAPKGTYRPFQSLKLGFRNQRLDPISHRCHVVEIRDPIITDGPILVVQNAPKIVDTRYEEYHLSSAQFSLEKPDDKSDVAASQSISAISQYTTVSNAMRNGDATRNSPLRAKVESCNARVVESSSGASWIIGDIEITIDGDKYNANIATETTESALSSDTQMGQGQTLYCHFPSLGTWYEYRIFSLLSFFESIREVAASSTAQTDVVLAPMPCKVLSIEKRNGEEVQAGETVMTIESMKMEVNIAVSKGGKFETTLKKGDAVDEGKLLCRVL